MTFRDWTMQALHVVMLFIVELLLTFPLSSEYKKIFFGGGQGAMPCGLQDLSSLIRE